MPDSNGNVISIRKPVIDAIKERNRRLEDAFRSKPPTVRYRDAYIGALVVLATGRYEPWLHRDYTGATYMDYVQITTAAEAILGEPSNYEPIETGFWVAYTMSLFDTVFPGFPLDELAKRHAARSQRSGGDGEPDRNCTQQDCR